MHAATTLCVCRRLFSSSPTKKLLRATAVGSLHPPRKTLKPITIALCGRPNVGKSSLFNRLVRSRLAIVNDEPGTTRDWREAEGQLGELRFTVLDTGGLDGGGGRRMRGEGAGTPPSTAANVEAKMLAHTERAIAGADVVLYVVDARRGVSSEDERFARWVKARRPLGGVHLVANKAEGLVGRAGPNGDERWDALVASCYSLGFGAPVPVSAEHGEGLGALYELAEPYAIVRGADTVTDAAAASSLELPPLIALHGTSSGAAGVSASALALPVGPAKRVRAVEARLARASAGVIHLAIVGRPNVGKSTLVNQLLGEERQLVGPTPGLTRDAVEVLLPLGDGRSVRLVDTAGMRRWGAWDLSTPLEGVAVGQAKKALALANVVALVVDGSGGAIAGLTSEAISFFGVADSAEGEGALGRSSVTPSHGALVSAVDAAQAQRSKSGSPSSLAASNLVAAAVSVASSTPLRSGHHARPLFTSASQRATRTEGILGGAFGLTRQDLAIAAQVLEEGRGLVIVLNKMDAAGPALAAEVARVVHAQVEALHMGCGATVVPVSALRGRGVEALLPAVVRTFDVWNTRVSTGRLNTWLRLVTRHHPPPVLSRSVARRGSSASKSAQDGTPLGAFRSVPLPLRVKYVTQVNARPPTFAAFVNRAKGFPESYKRFLVNALRDEFGLRGVPVRLLLSSPPNPYARRSGAQASSAAASSTAVMRGVEVGAPSEGARLVTRRQSPRPRRPGSTERRKAAGLADLEVVSVAAPVLKPFARSAAPAVRAATLPGGRMRYLSRKQKRVLRTALGGARKR